MAPPTLHNVSWCCHFAGLPSTFGVWRLVQLRLQTPPPPERQGQLPSLLIYAYITSFTIHGEAHRFTQEVQRHMIANFSVLELHLNPNGHVFGALVFRLLGMSQAHTAMQRLKVILKRSAGKEECPLDCICEPLDWRSQTISLNALQVVEINHFQGEDCEIDFLNLVLKSAPVLKRIIVRLSHEVSSRDDDDDDGYKRIYNIVAAYSSVVCYVYLSSGLMHGSQNCPST
uniref:Uncharacterized protein n=1 Tax=Avena sativa TaxID=4498 RepID=A0ACD6ACF1_AVESA